jgi:hypothetical protein
MTTKSDTPDNGQTDTLCNVCPVRTELAAITATAEDYRIQACKPDECKVKAERDSMSEKLAYVHSMGLRFGMMESSDRPEPYLAHEWTVDSDHERMFREWSHSIGWEDRVAKLEKERDQWKAKFIQANKDYGCELRDPYGTIWEHAAQVEKERDAFVNLLDPVDGNVVSAMVRLRDLLAEKGVES